MLNSKLHQITSIQSLLRVQIAIIALIAPLSEVYFYYFLNLQKHAPTLNTLQPWELGFKCSLYFVPCFKSTGQSDHHLGLHLYLLQPLGSQRQPINKQPGANQDFTRDVHL